MPTMTITRPDIPDKKPALWARTDAGHRIKAARLGRCGVRILLYPKDYPYPFSRTFESLFEAYYWIDEALGGISALYRVNDAGELEEIEAYHAPEVETKA